MCRRLWLPSTAFNCLPLPSTAFHCLLWYLFSEKRSVWLAGSKFMMQFQVAFIVRHCCTINMLTWCYIALSENRPPKSDVWSITWVYCIPHLLGQQHSFGTPFWLRPIHCRPLSSTPPNGSNPIFFTPLKIRWLSGKSSIPIPVSTLVCLKMEHPPQNI